VIDWLHATVPLWKALHVVALCLWCGGLLVLPVMLALHGPKITPSDYRSLSRGAHVAYTMVVTPAAVVAVIAGTWLIFLRDVFVPWLFAKLVFVALLMALHAWIGRGIVRMAERPGTHRPSSAYLTCSAVLASATAILVLVLGKPDLGWIAFPDWLRAPRGAQLPFDVPSR